MYIKLGACNRIPKDSQGQYKSTEQDHTWYWGDDIDTGPICYYAEMSSKASKKRACCPGGPSRPGRVALDQCTGQSEACRDSGLVRVKSTFVQDARPPSTYSQNFVGSMGWLWPSAVKVRANANCSQPGGHSQLQVCRYFVSPGSSPFSTNNLRPPRRGQRFCNGLKQGTESPS
jgi:hypothetical protein